VRFEGRLAIPLHPRGGVAIRNRIAEVLLGALAAALAACAPPTAGPRERLPVVSMTLVAGRATHTANVTWGARADSVIPIFPNDVPPDLVQLTVIGPDGSRYPIAPDPALQRFKADLPVEQGGLYRLEGTIDGRTVAASTVVPSVFEVREPAEDTVQVVADANRLFVTASLPLRIAGPEVRFVVSYLVDDHGTLQAGGTAQPADDSLRISAPSRGHWTLELLGFNAAGYDWLGRRNPRGNVTGATGGFTAAVLRSKVLLIE